MAEYNIKSITLPNGDVCNIKDTTYSAGSNITLTDTTFSLTKANVTGALGYTPPTSDTNNAVTQTATTTDANYEVLFSATADNTTRTEGVRKSSKLTFNPGSGALEMGNTSITDGLGHMELQQAARQLFMLILIIISCTMAEHFTMMFICSRQT